MDFSTAERNGYVRAFVKLWLEDPSNTYSGEELEGLAKGLLRGCEQHFRASITRVAKMVAKGDVEIFQQQAWALMELDSAETFQKVVDHATLFKL